MAINSYKLWTEEDINTLDQLYRLNLTVDQIARCLNRSERSIEHAIKNLMIQQVIHNGVEGVVDDYNIQQQAIYQDLVPDKYYPVAAADSNNSGPPAWPIVVMGLFIYLCVAGFGRYVSM